VLLTDASMPGQSGIALLEEIRRRPEVSPAAVVMLTPGASVEESEHYRELGVRFCLYKPVRKRELLSALLSAVGQSTPSRPAPVPSEEGSRSRALAILLVEDNRVNQLVATRMLEKMGHSITVAGNGQIALSLLAKQDFELVLMDVQMPEMDGLTATGKIRENEKSTGRHLPIIAMTAHAMKGDRERCMEAGMDGYVSKPISGALLEAAIAEVAGHYTVLLRPVRPTAKCANPMQARSHGIWRQPWRAWVATKSFYGMCWRFSSWRSPDI